MWHRGQTIAWSWVEFFRCLFVHCYFAYNGVTDRYICKIKSCCPLSIPRELRWAAARKSEVLASTFFALSRSPVTHSDGHDVCSSTDL